jgi:hypothetical protein
MVRAMPGGAGMNAQQLARWLVEEGACLEGRRFCAHLSLAEAWEKCDNVDWLLWFANAAGIGKVRVVRMACYFARESLRYLPVDDELSLRAIEAAERWCDKPTWQNETAAGEAGGALELDEIGYAAMAAMAAADAIYGDAGKSPDAYAYEAAMNSSLAASVEALDAAAAHRDKMRAYARYVREQVTIEELLELLPETIEYDGSQEAEERAERRREDQEEQETAASRCPPRE